MVHLTYPAVLAIAAALCTRTIQASNPVVIKGAKFFDAATKDQFFIKGVAYQPRTLSAGFADPLANPADCRRDFALMKDLGLNTVRVYEVDPNLNHDECMRILDEYGMYLLLDLAAATHSIVRTSPEYDTNIWNRVRATIDAFKGYSNTLGFFAGNEVTNDSKTTAASAYVKALLRDAKAYIRSSAPRKIPVGYANNDDPDIRLQVQAYFNCGPEEERVDFFGINLYEWCGDGATYQSSGYVDRTADISSYSVPVFLSEFGCNLVSPRAFTEVKSIFGPDMQNTWSGGIVYEWSQEENNYGLVKINADNTVTPLQDYVNLKQVLSGTRPVGVNMDLYNEQRAASACPLNTPAWEATSVLPPTPSSSVCDCMLSSLTCIASAQALASTEHVGDLLNTVCGMTSCDDIATNGKTGVYGKYSFCNSAQKLSYVFNSYYTVQGLKSTESCNFNGMATVTTAQTAGDQGCAAIAGSGVPVQAAASVTTVASASSLNRSGSIIWGLLGVVAALHWS
ncbi:1,3-beta-glucanosyltransferase gas1 [Podila epigama]|nr:1,3-beta-glucanosyltransferase gas1 [Podila epigama]